MRTKLGYSIGLFLLFAFLYTRFINLSWGLPYPFHPDERNMAVALQQLHCSLPAHGETFNLKECFNPHFFAYGQFPLYLGFILISIYHALHTPLNTPLFSEITFAEATMILRLISVFASAGTLIMGICVVRLLQKKHEGLSLVAIGFSLIFSPGLIQMAHFGTTESLLTFFYTTLIYLTLYVVTFPNFRRKYVYLAAFICGLAIATKISAGLFFGLPLMYFVSQIKTEDIKEVFFRVVLFSVVAGFIGVMLSPFNIIDLTDFLSSLHYESSVALGQVDVFYTKQFAGTVPVLFQFIKIFPFAIGLPVLVGFIGSLFFLPYSKQMNLLRFSFFLYFLPTAYMYTKWSRFMSPVFPLMIIMAVLFLLQLYEYISKAKPARQLTYATIIITVAVLYCIHGVAFLSIYKDEDTRFQTSDWIYRNVISGTNMLGETANVVDLPIATPLYPNPHGLYRAVPFNFYDLDSNKDLQYQLADLQTGAEYILVPSRRIFWDYTCVSVKNGDSLTRSYIDGYNPNSCSLLEESYPQLSRYYNGLFSGSFGFIPEKVISSYPHISILGYTLQFPDEEAEETWTVFDHPVIRIYKRFPAIHSVSS